MLSHIGCFVDSDILLAFNSTVYEMKAYFYKTGSDSSNGWHYNFVDNLAEMRVMKKWIKDLHADQTLRGTGFVV